MIFGLATIKRVRDWRNHFSRFNQGKKGKEKKGKEKEGDEQESVPPHTLKTTTEKENPLEQKNHHPASGKPHF